MIAVTWANRRTPRTDDRFRLRHLHQGAPFAPALATRRPPARTAQTLSFLYLQIIAAGRFGTVVTVLRQLILQLPDQRLPGCRLPLQKGNLPLSLLPV